MTSPEGKEGTILVPSSFHFAIERRLSVFDCVACRLERGVEFVAGIAFGDF